MSALPPKADIQEAENHTLGSSASFGRINEPLRSRMSLGDNFVLTRGNDQQELQTVSQNKGRQTWLSHSFLSDEGMPQCAINTNMTNLAVVAYVVRKELNA